MINDIRLASSESYNHVSPIQINRQNDADRNFDEIINNKSDEKEQNINNIPLHSFGAPAGFFADISMLNEDDAKKIGIIQMQSMNNFGIY